MSSLQVLQDAGSDEDTRTSKPWLHELAFHALASVLHAAGSYSPKQLAALQQQFTDAGGLQPLLAELARLRSNCDDGDDDEECSWRQRCLASSLIRAVSQLCRGANAQHVLLDGACQQLLVLLDRWGYDDYVATYALHTIALVMQVCWHLRAMLWQVVLVLGITFRSMATQPACPVEFW